MTNGNSNMKSKEKNKCAIALFSCLLLLLSPLVVGATDSCPASPADLLYHWQMLEEVGAETSSSQPQAQFIIIINAIKGLILWRK